MRNEPTQPQFQNQFHSQSKGVYEPHQKWQLLLATLLTAIALLLLLFSANALVGQAAEAALPQGISLFFTDNLTATTTTQTPTTMELTLLAAINGATTTIDAAIYDFDRVSIRDALIAAKNRGVAVRVVGDNEARVSEKSKASFDLLEVAGIPMVFDGKIAAAEMSPVVPDGIDPAAIAEMDTSRIMHDKYFIIDKQRLWTGSVNMSDTDLTKNHNHALLFENPALAAIYQTDFDQMWGGVFGNQKTTSPTTTVTIDGMATTVVFAPQDAPIAAIVKEIDAARQSIDFAIFFFTHDDVRDALIRAQQRGVRIRGLWDRLGSADGSSDDEALCQAGVAIKIEDTSGIMHHKMMVLDAGGAEARVVAGSLNWTAGGTTYNNENTLILRDEAVADAFAQAFAKMWNGIAVAPCNPERQAGSPISFLPIVHNESQIDPPLAPTVTPVPTATQPGPTPTSSPTTPTLPPGAVEILSVVYDPPGQDLENERVVIANRTSMALSLAGWTLRDDANNPNVYTFPAFSLAPGAQATVWVKADANTATDLFWGRSQPVWNNDGDVAYLRSAQGVQIDACAYLGGAEASDCQ